MFPLEARIKQLEKKVKLLESSLIAAINTNSLLEKKVDNHCGMFLSKIWDLTRKE